MICFHMRLEDDMPEVIDSFDGDYRWLSNFWPCEVEFEGEMYPSVEHAYQAAKTTDPTLRKVIAEAKTPGKAKKLGNGLALRNDWQTVKMVVMEQLLRQKFAPSSELATKLLETGSKELVEGNWWGDVYWGVCKGNGENNLGKLLMKIRGKIGETS